MKTLTLEEYHAAIKAQGVPAEHVAFRCPMCGTVQSAQDLIAAGAGKNLDEAEKFLGFSCFGRWTHCKPPPREKGTHPRFALATPEEAQAHMDERDTVAAS